MVVSKHGHTSKAKEEKEVHPIKNEEEAADEVAADTIKKLNKI